MRSDSGIIRMLCGKGYLFMDIAVMSDIHSNHVAFERCISYALERGIRTFFFLGDYVGDLAYPQKTLDILYHMRDEYKCFFVKGNREDYLLDYRDGGERGWKEEDSTTGCLFYIYHQMRERDMEFFRSLPPVLRLSSGDFSENIPPLTICHGSPQRVNEKLLPDAERTFEIMRGETNPLILCGHTHIQGKIAHGGRTVLNAGSIGIPLHSEAKSQFMILHGSAAGYEEEFISLSYDTKKAAQELSDSGLSQRAPSWCRVTVRLLQDGEISHGEVLARAMALCRQETGSCKWPEIPEKYWERAAEEMGL